jgi:signal transduction histidine kinase
MRPRSLSLRARLLAGLIAVTTVFLVVMGVVSWAVLGNVERGEFNDALLLAAKGGLTQLASGQDEYATAYASRAHGVGLLTPSTPAGQELVAYLNDLISAGNAGRTMSDMRGKVTDISLPGYPALRATVRALPAKSVAADPGLLPPGRYDLLIGRPLSAAGSAVQSLVLAELIAGAALLALLALAGRWLIGRGLAPLDRMASTADVITSRGDLTARMPDPGDRHEAGRLVAAINTMLDKIQQAFGARWQSEQKVRQFAADASHELRTPLTTIRGYAELYRQGALGPAELPNAMRRIEQEADRMSSLVAELLELARLDRTSSLNLTEVDLTELVRDAVADANAVEPARPIRVETPPTLIAIADEPRLRQVLANLLGNVRSHTPPGTPVTVQLVPAFGGALIEIADAGPGMTADDAARAFDRFHRGARSGDASPGYRAGRRGDTGAGSGLGLSIVQAIAAAHGGHARLLSAAGRGTTVQVWIPLKAAIPNERAVPRPARATDS